MLVTLRRTPPFPSNGGCLESNQLRPSHSIASHTLRFSGKGSPPAVPLLHLQPSVRPRLRPLTLCLRQESCPCGRRFVSSSSCCAAAKATKVCRQLPRDPEEDSWDRWKGWWHCLCCCCCRCFWCAASGVEVRGGMRRRLGGFRFGFRYGFGSTINRCSNGTGEIGQAEGPFLVLVGFPGRQPATHRLRDGLPISSSVGLR